MPSCTSCLVKCLSVGGLRYNCITLNPKPETPNPLNPPKTQCLGGDQEPSRAPTFRNKAETPLEGLGLGFRVWEM